MMSVCTWTIGRAAEDPGEHVYDGNCKRCHGPEGRGARAANLIPFYRSNRLEVAAGVLLESVYSLIVFK